MFPAKDYMTTNLVKVMPNTLISDAVQLLSSHRVSGLPVVDELDNLVGVISEWDVLSLLTDTEVKKNDVVSNYMSSKVLSFRQDASMVDICEFFKNENKRRAPITDNDGKLVGIVSRHDVINLIIKIKRKSFE